MKIYTKKIANCKECLFYKWIFDDNVHVCFHFDNEEYPNRKIICYGEILKENYPDWCKLEDEK